MGQDWLQMTSGLTKKKSSEVIGGGIIKRISGEVQLSRAELALHEVPW